MFTDDDRFIKRFDFILLLTTLALVFCGLIAVKSSTMSLRAGSMHYLKTQTIAFVLGLIIAFVLMFIDYEIYGHLYIPIYILSNVLLIAVVFWGYGAETWGANNWLRLGPISFQPSEISKFGVIIAFAKFIDVKQDVINNPLVVLQMIVVAAIPVALVMLQEDLGTAVVFAFFLVIMIFCSGISYKYILPVAAVAAIILIAGYFFFSQKLEECKAGDESNFRYKRIFVFLDPEFDTQGDGYQVHQARMAIGSGKIYGRGLYKGVQNQYGFIPTKQTDSIFAVWCEELGFLGGFILIMLYAVFLSRFVRIAKHANDLFGAEIVIGLMGMFLFHILENIGMNMGMMPVTGIPLPFVSYGGTFMLLNVASVGMVISVGLKKKRYDKYNF